MTSPQTADEHPFGKPPENLPSWLPGPETRSQGGNVHLEIVDLRRRRDRGRFLDVVDPIYEGDRNYIKPLTFERMGFLDLAKNPALAAIDVHAVIAYRSGHPVGRITGHVDREYNRYHEAKAGWFGFFESINDPTVAHALLDEAVRWVKGKGMTEVIGPNNFTTNHQLGCLVENFSRPPMVEMTYNPPYYDALIRSYGMDKAKDLYAWWIDVTGGLDDPKIARFHAVAEKVKKRYKLTVRSARFSDFRAEVERLFKVYNESWQKNWGFVPVSEAEFEQIAKDLKPVLIEDLVLLVEHEGKPVGFALTAPDVNEVMPKNGKLFPLGWYKLLRGIKKTRHGRLITLGVLPGFRKRGVEAILCVETALRVKSQGMAGGEISWLLEDNELVNRAAESMGARLDRKYRLYGLDLRSQTRIHRHQTASTR